MRLFNLTYLGIVDLIAVYTFVYIMVYISNLNYVYIYGVYHPKKPLV